MYPANSQQTLAIALAAASMVHAALAAEVCAQERVSNSAKPWPQVSREGTSAFVDGKTLWLQLDANTVNGKKAVMPRLCAPIRSVGWKGQPDSDLKIRPAQQEWRFTWKEAPTDSSTIEVVF